MKIKEVNLITTEYYKIRQSTIKYADFGIQNLAIK